MTPADERMTTVVVGDVAGHLSALDEVLEPFAVCVASATVPSGIRVVQVGDLVGRSTESDELIACVDRVRRRHPEQWVQLAGNHELHHLGGHQFEGTRELSADAVHTLREWLDERWLRIATSLDVGRSGILVTHAGLTRNLWSELGSPLNATRAASALEALRDTANGWEVINRPGRMLNLGSSPITNESAGPIWAEASEELLPDWIAHGDLPFDQIHGHSSAFNWFRGRLRNGGLAANCEVDRDRRHVVTRIAAHTITGIDPGLGNDGHSRWEPLVVEL